MVGLLALALALIAGVCLGVATHSAYQWFPWRLGVALGVGVALQGMLFAGGPDWHLFAPHRLVFARILTGAYRIGLVFLPVSLVPWSRPVGRFGSALLVVASVLIVGGMSFPLCVATINFNGVDVPRMSDIVSAIVFLVGPVGLGLGIGRTVVQQQLNTKSRAGTT